MEKKIFNLSSYRYEAIPEMTKQNSPCYGCNFYIKENCNIENKLNKNAFSKINEKQAEQMFIYCNNNKVIYRHLDNMKYKKRVLTIFKTN